jgi:hypothetical protein
VHVGRAQDAQPAVGDHLVAALVAGHGVFTHAEEGEIVRHQPFEELGRLGDLLDRQRRRTILDLGDQLADARQHRAPVGDAQPYVLQRRADPLDDLGLARLVLDTLDMHVDEAFARRGADRGSLAAKAEQRAGVIALHREDRMQDQADVEPLLGQLAHHRVEQERHVGVDHLDDRDRLDALGADRTGTRLEAQLGHVRLALLQEQPGRFGEVGELARLVAHQILRRRCREQELRETFRHVTAQALQDRARLLDQPACCLFVFGGELPRNVHGLLPGWRNAPLFCRTLTDPDGGVERYVGVTAAFPHFFRPAKAVRWHNSPVATGALTWRKNSGSPGR